MGSCSSKKNFSTEVQKVAPKNSIREPADVKVVPSRLKESESEPTGVSDQFSEGGDLEIQTFSPYPAQIGGSPVRKHGRSFSTVPSRNRLGISEAGEEVVVATNTPIVPVAPVVALPPSPQPKSPPSRHKRFKSEIICKFFTLCLKVFFSSRTKTVSHQIPSISARSANSHGSILSTSHAMC